MIKDSVEVDITTTPLLSIDGIYDFTHPQGRYPREFGADARPILDWGERCKTWIASSRGQFGNRLRHVAVISHYTPGQFTHEFWPLQEQHPLYDLCCDDDSRILTIDDPKIVEHVEKTENDATTSPKFMDFVKQTRAAVLLAITTTTCVDKTLARLLPQMQKSEVALQTVIMARDGVASRRSRQKDEKRILDELSEDPRLIMVPRLEDIRWVAD